MGVTEMRRFLALPVVAAVVLAGCGGQNPSAAPSASTAAIATLAAEASAPAPSPTVSATDTPAPPSAEPTGVPKRPSPEYPIVLNWADEVAMRVIVSDLNVRTRPSTSGAKIGKAPKNSVFLFQNWPTKADGFEWYYGWQAVLDNDGSIPALPNDFGSSIDRLAGWVAAGTSDAPYLQPVPARCPTTIDVANVQGMLDSERVSCFGSDKIQLTGTYGCGDCGGLAPGSFKPKWLADPLNYSFLSITPFVGPGSLGIRFPPSGDPAPPEGTIIHVTAHFSDAASSTCAIAPMGDSGNVLIPSGLAKQYCQAQFVVDSFEVKGTDPGFPH
jgi:hypothetical protein